MSPKVEKVLSELNIAEGPHWDVSQQCLYFVDVLNKCINKYDPVTNKNTKATLGEKVSIIIPVKRKNDQFLITLGNKIAKITWDGESPEISEQNILYEVEQGTENTFNDGKCDALGRLWAGVLGPIKKNIQEMTEGLGALYSFKDQNIQKHITKVNLSNGMAFDYNLQKLYYIDSLKGTVDQYDFDLKNGSVENLTEIFNKRKHNLDRALFDGMTIDTDGNLWIAVFGCGKVIKIDPRKPETLLESIHFPTPCITSVAFGGANLDELYVTSAKFPSYGSDEGYLFKVTGLNTRGLPADEVVL